MGVGLVVTDKSFRGRIPLQPAASDSRTEYAVSTLEQCLRKSTIFCRATGRIGRLSGISL
jgi:hypothetical protein